MYYVAIALFLVTESQNEKNIPCTYTVHVVMYEKMTYFYISRYTPGTGPVVRETCDDCGFRYNVGGPVWAEPMHSPEFVQAVIDSVEKERGRFNTAKRIVGMLSVVKEELHDIPFYYTTEGLCTVLHCEMISFPVLRYSC